MTHDPYLLANQYLDGELDAVEVARVHADPSVMAIVADMRAMQSLLTTTVAPAPGVQAAALAAAMAEFNVTATATATATATTASVTPIGAAGGARHRLRSWAVGTAAAAAVIGVVAIGAIVATRNHDSSSGDAQSMARDEQVSELTASEAAADTGDTGDTGAGSEAPKARRTDAEPAAPAAASTGAADDSATPAELAATTIASASLEMADETGSTVAADVMSAGEAEPPVVIPVTDRDEVIDSPGALAGLGQLLRQLRDTGELGPTPDTRCAPAEPTMSIIDAARYRFDDGVADVLVAVADDDSDVTLAINPDTCEVVVTGP